MHTNSQKHPIQPSSVTAKQFLETIFYAKYDDEIIVACHPDSFVKDGETKDFFRNFDASTRRGFRNKAWYYCVSTANPLPDGKIKRTLGNVANAYVLVLDDIGTKARMPPVEPHYVIETSPGNFQVGYCLMEWDVSTRRGAVFYDSCLYAMALAGYNDPGNRSATRVVRLPGSLHKTGFEARLVKWNMDIDTPVWHLEDLMVAFGVEPVRPPRTGGNAKPGKYTDLKQVRDPILDHLAARGMLLGSDEKFQFIECPWRSEHTDNNQGSTSTAYSPLDYEREGRQFRCLHGHCADRGVPDLLAWVAADGGPDLNPTSAGRPGPFGE